MYDEKMVNLWELITRVIEYARRQNYYQTIMRTEGGGKYLTYGLSRRILHLIHILKSFADQLPSDRKIPLSFDESQPLNVLLNMFYIDVFGLLDNISWILAYETERVKDGCVEEEYKFKIGLFKPETINMLEQVPGSEGILNTLSELKNWFVEELENKRHPSAHRIPLYFIPSILTPSQGDDYLTNREKHAAAFNDGNLHEACKLTRQLETLGTFSFMFGHSERCPFPIYPTIIDDCKNSLSILDEVFRLLETL